MIVVDDKSSDGTAAKIRSTLPSLRAEVVVRTNSQRLFSLRNIAEAIRNDVASPEDVVCIVDGDDWLNSPSVVDRLDIEYSRGALMTYGSFVDEQGRPSNMRPYPDGVVASGLYRRHRWMASHLKTFKRHLFDRLSDDCFVDGDKWLQMAGDVALMIPMLEMARERAKFVRDHLYVYNTGNPINDHKVSRREQIRAHRLVSGKRSHARL